MVMSQRDDRIFQELIDHIRWVVGRRYVEDPEALGSPFYTMASGDEPSFAFASLNRTDRLRLLADMIPWRHYGNEGITADQQRVIISNVLDGKPPERWLQGVFAPTAQEKAFRDLVRTDPLMDRKHPRERDRFDRAVAKLRQQYSDDGFGDKWKDLSQEEKVRYLATFAQAHDVPVDRFFKAAQHVLGGVELSGYDEWFVRDLRGKVLWMRSWEEFIFSDRKVDFWEQLKPYRSKERGGREM
jgi:hypothetical protein